MELVQSLPLSFKFTLEKSKDKNKDVYWVYARIIYKRERALISLKMEAQKDDWDFVNHQFIQSKKINIVKNNKLRSIVDELTQIYLDLKRTGSPISSKVIKNIYNGDIIQSSDVELMTFYNKHLEELKLQTNEYTDGVIGHYVKTQTHLMRFLKLNGLLKIKMNELSRKFIERFENYLLSTPNAQTGRPMNSNTSATYIRKLKATVNAAYRMEVIPTNPFVSFKMHPIKSANKIVLTQEELDVLHNHTLDNNFALDKVRKMFLFCCATGLRHSDAMQLHNDMIRKDEDGVYWISMSQQKTGDNVEIPLSNVAEKIYHEFKPHRISTGFVLPMLSNQKVNDALKAIAKKVGINKNISWHVARHTFATNSLNHGVDIAAVSSLMGHRTIKTTQIYGKITRKRKVDVIKFLNAKTTVAKPKKKKGK